jgi:hypothetical protein
MTTFSPIECYEIHGSRSEDWNLQDGKSCTVQLLTPYSKRDALANDLLTAPRFWPYGSGLRPPAVACGIAPVPGAYTQNGQGMDYDWATLTVEYGNTGEQEPEGGGQQPGDRQLITEQITPTVEMITHTPKGLYLAPPTWKPEDDAPPRNAVQKLEDDSPPWNTYRSFAIVRTLYNIPRIPTSILDLPGKCNDTQYTSKLLGMPFPRGTLLFQPDDLSRTISLSGSDGWNVQLRFLYQKRTWNKFLNQDGEVCHLIRVKNDGQNPPGNFTAEAFEPIEYGDFSDWLF